MSYFIPNHWTITYQLAFVLLVAHFSGAAEGTIFNAKRGQNSKPIDINAQHKTDTENRMAAQTKALQTGESSKIVNQQTTQKEVEEKQDQLDKHMFKTVVKRGVDNAIENVKTGADHIVEYVKN